MRNTVTRIVAGAAIVMSAAAAGACDRNYTVGLGFAPMYYPYAPAAPVASGGTQQGLSDIIGIIQIVGDIITRLRPGGPQTGGDADGLSRVSESLSRVERKMDRLEDLIENRLRRLEEDVETLQKSQREASAQLDHRIVETTGLVHRTNQVFADRNDAIVESILRTQQQTAILLAQLKVPGAAPVTLQNAVPAKAFPSGDDVSIPAATRVDVLGEVGDESAPLVIVRWTSAGKTILATAMKDAVK